MENRIKEQQLFLFANRTSCRTMRANQLRLWMSAAAYVLLLAVRQHGLKGTSLEGTQRVITRFTESNVNLAKPFEKIIEAAGFTIWPKLIQNLRASCETEWLDSGIPAHVVAKWIGHSVKVQNDNYAQVDDHHFDQFNASAKLVQSDENVLNGATASEPTVPVAPPVAPKTREMAKTDKPSKTQNPAKTNVLRGSADSFASLRIDQVPEAGVEPAHGITHTGF